MQFNTRIHQLRTAVGISKLQIKNWTGLSIHVITKLDTDPHFVPKDAAAKYKVEAYLEALLKQKEQQITTFHSQHGYQHIKGVVE